MISGTDVGGFKVQTEKGSIMRKRIQVRGEWRVKGRGDQAR